MSDFATSHVYVIGPNIGPQKIGVAVDVTKRLDALQTGCPFDLRVHHAEIVDQELAIKVERIAHGKLAARRQRGEWFNVEPDLAIRAVKSAVLEMENGTAPARFRDHRDSLLLAHRRGRLSFQFLEAGLAYRQLRRAVASASDYQARDGSAFSASLLLHKIEGEVVRGAGAEGLRVLLKVAHREEPVAPGEAETLDRALSVVARMLDSQKAA